MSKVDVWMPLYIGDYLADTSRLTTEQHGAYLLLIMDYWRSGPIPDDDAVLAQITRMSPDAWSIASGTIRAFFEQSGSTLIHHRIDRLMIEAGDKRAKAKAKAEAAAAKRWGKDAKSDAPSIGQAVHKECPSPSPSEVSTTNVVDSPVPADVPVDKSVPPSATPAKKESTQGKRLPDDWKLPKAWGEWALEDNPALTAEDVRKEGEKFRNHWVAKAGKDARKLDWKATWANWIRSDYVKPSGISPTSGSSSANWFLTSTGIEAKGVELGLEKADDELFPYYKARVYAAAGITEDMVRKAQNDIPRQAR